MTDKYIVKPSRITDERGFVSSIDDYVEHNLPCGGSSGSNNNDSIVNEIMNLDNRIETVEEQVRKLKNESSANVDVNTIMNTEFDYSGYEMQIDNEKMTITPAPKDKNISMKDWLSTHEMESITLFGGMVNLNQQLQSIGTSGVMKDVDKNLTEINETYSIINFPVYLFDVAAGALVKRITFGKDFSPLGVEDSIYQLVRIHNATQKQFEFFYFNDYDILWNDVEAIKEQISQQQSVTATTTGGNGDALLIIDQQIATLNNTVKSHTNSIQSLDTRTGSHTASIGSLENRINELETLVNTQKTLITELQNRLTLLESTK